MLQQINHGISTGMLFMVIGIIYERRHTRLIAEYGGLAHVMPKFAIIFAIAMLSSAGLPLLNGFIGEFTILQGAFEANRIWAAFAVTGVILGAAYLLWLYQRTMLGQVTNGKESDPARPKLPRNRHVRSADRRGQSGSAFIRNLTSRFCRTAGGCEIVERVHPGYFNGGVLAHLAQPHAPIAQPVGGAK